MILARLIELNVLRDPDDLSYGSDEESEELKDGFDFLHHAKRRVGRLFKNKRSKQQKEKALRDLMPKNDFAVCNSMLEKVIEHEKIIK